MKIGSAKRMIWEYIPPLVISVSPRATRRVSIGTASVSVEKILSDFIIIALSRNIATIISLRSRYYPEPAEQVRFARKSLNKDH
jgi:hypothetical protein